MVDGNVIRVIARLRAISANPKDSVTIKKLWWAFLTPTIFLLLWNLICSWRSRKLLLAYSFTKVFPLFNL